MMEEEIINEETNIEEREKEVKREIVAPGEVLAAGDEFLPGDGTRREGKEIIASRFGLAEKSGRFIKIISLSGVYMPRRGNIVLARVLDITFNGWIMDIGAPYLAFLPITECPRFFNRYELSENADIGDMMVCKVDNVKPKGVDLTIMSKGLGKLENGMIMHVNPNKVPRVIGKEGSMIYMIKEDTQCDIVVGQNGVIWMKGDSIDQELAAKEVIMFVTARSYLEGLTEKTKDFLESRRNGK